jgi:hypothetical protein
VMTVNDLFLWFINSDFVLFGQLVLVLLMGEVGLRSCCNQANRTSCSKVRITSISNYLKWAS